MKKISMVFSAPMMIYLFEQSWMNENPEMKDKWVRCITQVINRIKHKCDERLDGRFSLELGLLYNAYVEERLGWFYEQNNKLGFDKIYADSGGLQVLTRGLDIDSALKQSVYKNQSPADFAMCFDEIPAVNAQSSERATISSRLFYPDLIEEKAILTGKNINEQCQYFIESGKPVETFIINQANNYTDMLKWYDIVREQISDDNFKNIAGTALSFACIGTDTRESIENMIGYHTISQKYGLNDDRLHLLGYGAASRIYPSVMMFNSPLFDNKILSFDSSSLTMGYMMGRFLDANGKTTKIENSAQARVYYKKFFEQVKDIFHDIFGDFDDDEFLNHVSDNYRTISPAVALGEGHDELSFLTRVFVPTITLWQTVYLMDSIITMIDEASGTYMDISRIDDVGQLVDWFNQYKGLMKSKRVTRKSFSDIDSFFI